MLLYLAVLTDERRWRRKTDDTSNLQQQESFRCKSSQMSFSTASVFGSVKLQNNKSYIFWIKVTVR